jgi:hypothetical protein
VRLGDDFDALRMQNRAHPESSELELVADDRLAIVARLPDIDHVGQ